MQDQKGLPVQVGNIILIAVGIITIVAIGVSAGYFFAQKSKIAEQKQAQDKQEQKEEVKDETANWKTYRNEGYGFEFKYPGDWIVQGNKYKEFNIYRIEFISPETVKAIADNEAKSATDEYSPQMIGWSANLSIEDTNFITTSEYKNDLIKKITEHRGDLGDCFTEKEAIFIPGYQVLHYATCDAPPAGEYIEWIARGKKYSIGIFDYNRLDQILSTFKFIK